MVLVEDNFLRINCNFEGLLQKLGIFDINSLNCKLTFNEIAGRILKQQLSCLFQYYSQPPLALEIVCSLGNKKNLIIQLIISPKLITATTHPTEQKSENIFPFSGLQEGNSLRTLQQESSTLKLMLPTVFNKSQSLLIIAIRMVLFTEILR